VASGRYQQAEFAADLWQVYLREGSDEYKTPSSLSPNVITEGLQKLLANALRRLPGPARSVVELQTNFGGGRRTRCSRCAFVSAACLRDNCRGWRR